MADGNNRPHYQLMVVEEDLTTEEEFKELEWVERTVKVKCYLRHLREGKSNSEARTLTLERDGGENNSFQKVERCSGRPRINMPVQTQKLAIEKKTNRNIWCSNKLSALRESVRRLFSKAKRTGK